jgi:hypothetical protein
MDYELNKSIEILSRTPRVLETLLMDLNDEWTAGNEGPDTWSPYDIVGHLIHGEKIDWMERMDIILNRDDKNFKTFDRFAQFTESKGKSLKELLVEFKQLREKNIKTLLAADVSGKLDMTGIHPKFGEVTLRQLLTTWTVHDLSHLAQIARVMAKQYKDETGPWIEYLPILNK